VKNLVIATIMSHISDT